MNDTEQPKGNGFSPLPFLYAWNVPTPWGLRVACVVGDSMGIVMRHGAHATSGGSMGWGDGICFVCVF